MILNFRDRVKYLNENTANRQLREICQAVLEMSSYTPESSLVGIYIARLAKLDENTLSNFDKKMITFESRWRFLNDLGLQALEGALNESSLRSQPQFMYTIDNVYSNYRNGNAPAAMVIEPMIEALSHFQFDNSIKEACTKLYEAIHDHAEEIMIMKALYMLGGDKNRIVYESVFEKLENYLFEYNTHLRANLIKGLMPYGSNPLIADLIGALNKCQSLEEARDGRVFAAASDGNFIVENVCGLVHEDNGVRYFSAGQNFYTITEAGITPLSKNQISNLPKTFVKVSTILGSDAITVTENAIDVMLGGKYLVNMRKSTGTGWDLYLNEQTTDIDSIGRYIVTTSINGSTALQDLNALRFIVENSNELQDLPFAKRIRSRHYPDVHAVIFANEDGTISANIKNPAMSVNEWLQGANGMQVRNRIIETLNFDVASVLEGFINKDVEEFHKIEESQKIVLENIDILHQQLENVIGKTKDILIENNTEVSELIKMLESEIAENQAIYDDLQNQKYRLQHFSNNVHECSVGDRVSVDGVSGDITSIDDNNGIAIVLTDDGRTVEVPLESIDLVSEKLIPIREGIEIGAKVRIGSSDIMGTVTSMNTFDGTYIVLTDSGDTIEVNAGDVVSLEESIEKGTESQAKKAAAIATGSPVIEAEGASVIPDSVLIQLAEFCGITQDAITGVSLETSLERLKLVPNMAQEQKYLEVEGFQFMIVPLGGTQFVFIGKTPEGEAFALEAHTTSAIGQDEKYGNVSPHDDAPVTEDKDCEDEEEEMITDSDETED